MAGRHLDRRSRRTDRDRRRPLSGLPRNHAGIPRRLEDRGDERPDEAMDQLARAGRPPLADGGVHAGRQSSSSKQRSTTTPKRPSGLTEPSPNSSTTHSARSCSASSPRADRLRALLVQRRTLPPDLSHVAVAAQSAIRSGVDVCGVRVGLLRAGRKPGQRHRGFQALVSDRNGVFRANGPVAQVVELSPLLTEEMVPRKHPANRSTWGSAGSSALVRNTVDERIG